MTTAAIPLLERHNNTELTKELLQKIYLMKYDPRDLPIQQKNGVTIGM